MVVWSATPQTIGEFVAATSFHRKIPCVTAALTTYAPFGAAARSRALDRAMEGFGSHLRQATKALIAIPVEAVEHFGHLI